MPQIQIKLNLVCPGTSETNTGFQEIALHDEAQNLGEIIFSKTVTLVKIIILDENDNDPQFIYPPPGSVIGYPVPELSMKLLPRELIEVDAVDADEGLNAKIKFWLPESDEFIINEETGVIYASRVGMTANASIELEIMATDRDGASHGHNSKTTLKVVSVQEEHIVVLHFERENLEDVEELVFEIAEESQIDLRIVNFFAYATDPGVEAKQALADTNIAVFVYGFEVGSANLFPAAEILELLSELDLGIAFTFTKYNDYYTSGCDVTGLVIAVSILGALLLIICIGTPLLWFLWLKNKLKGSTRKNSNASVKPLEEDFSEVADGRSSPVAVIQAENETENRVRDAEIMGVTIEGATQGEMRVLTLAENN